MQHRKRRYPIGAELVGEKQTDFRIWAPKARQLDVVVEDDSNSKRVFHPLRPEPRGYFSGTVSVGHGARYRFRVNADQDCYPDPASRFQPDGPHGSSCIIDPTKFPWSDAQWPGLKMKGQIIYEMHVGTFTKEGVWRDAAEQLSELARIGITVIEMMPIADFPGRFGWGYDGVDLFAPTHLYGGPDDFRQFVNQAHAAGLGVILDVVYNHFGPDGNFLKEFSEDYFTDRHKNEWGESLNFDGQNSGAVREFFCANAAYWIEEFHLDGLRLDATQQIFDASPEHILTALAGKVRHAAQDRATFLVAENEAQTAQLVRSPEAGGYGLDA